MDQNKIGRFIAKKRKEHDLTQVQLAEKLGVSNKSVSKWERGVCMPEVALYQELCKVLGITINELFAGEELKKTDVETKSEETIMSIAQDGSNKEKKLRSRIIALVVVVCLLAAGFIYAYSKWRKDEVVPTNYIRAYTYTEDGEAVKKMMTDDTSELGLIQYSIDDTFTNATLVIDKYRGNELVSSRESITLDKLHGNGLISAAFNLFEDKYKLKIADSVSSSDISEASITDDEANIEEFESSMVMIGEEPIDIKSGDVIPLFVFYISSDGRTCSYGPDKVEELAKEGKLDFVDYTMVVKVKFE